MASPTKLQPAVDPGDVNLANQVGAEPASAHSA
jgi:hypothetical protein